MIGLDSYSRQVFIYLNPILIYVISDFYLQYAKKYAISCTERPE